jgi:RNA polymerase sigma-70 factor (ECF subfamily)
MRVNPSPVVALNQAVAVAMMEGPEQGLKLLNEIDLPQYHLLPAAKAHLLGLLDRPEEAAAHYRQAISLARTEPERRFLAKRLAEQKAV